MCGVLGIVRYEGQAAPDLYTGLITLQHRAHDSAGAGTFDKENNSYHIHKGMGEVPTVLTKDVLKELRGSIGVGHVRWTTVGNRNIADAHPVEFIFRGKKGLIVHNGEIKEDELALKFPDYRPDLSTDTKFLAALLTTSGKDTIEEAIQEMCAIVKGTYSLLILFYDTLYAVRDTTGNRPLVFGENENGFIVSSETATLGVLDGNIIDEVRPGEIIAFRMRPRHFHRTNINIVPLEMPRRLQFCLFEMIYLLSPDSIFLGRTVEFVRRRMGRNLFQEHPLKADIVCGVADSGLPAARGFAEASGIRNEVGLFRSHYAGRMFIDPIEDRPNKTIIKHRIIEEVVSGKEIVIVDDSIVEGRTTKRIVSLLRRRGAKKVYVLSGSPMITHPCYHGVPTGIIHRSLIAGRHKGDVEKIRQEIGADYLGFARLESTIDAVINTLPYISSYPPLDFEGFCKACFTGHYTIPFSVNK